MRIVSMIDIRGNAVDLRTYSRREHSDFWRLYIADPIMDPNVYLYDSDEVDGRFERMRAKADWYPIVGIFEKASGNVVGELSFKRINRVYSCCELGIILARDDYKGKGYGTEAITLAIEYAFDKLYLKTVLADTMGGNAAMRNILEKLGFCLVGTEPHRYDMGDRLEDKLFYRLDKEISEPSRILSSRP